MLDVDGESKADIQAVSRTSRILGLFSVDRTELVTVDVAAALGLNRTTTHRYLTSMVAVGLLEPGSRHSSYVLGPLAAKLGAMATGSAPVLAVAPRYTSALSEELGATVALSLWASTGPMVVHVAEPRVAGAVLSVRVGTVLRVDTAKGVLFSAYLESESGRIDALRQKLKPGARAAFDERLARARQGGALVVRHLRAGIVAVAAPIFDATGMCAALAAVGLVSTATDEAIPEHSRRIRETADQITASLGGEVPDIP
jgi:DNA-binding IclR family transcriptional regulator